MKRTAYYVLRNLYSSPDIKTRLKKIYVGHVQLQYAPSANFRTTGQFEVAIEVTKFLLYFSFELLWEKLLFLSDLF
jgi:hypothetical protein